MPCCQGRSDGHCPNNRNDDSVKWPICDLVFCADCLNFRIPALVNDNMASSPLRVLDTMAASDVSKTATGNMHEKVIINEILCYLQQKSMILTFDNLVSICVDFYTNEEVEHARQLPSN